VNQAEYLQRMKTCPAFKRVLYEPQWRPGEGDVRGFCHDEVTRQYHDTTRWEDGGIRVEWMIDAWCDADLRSEGGPPNVRDILDLGHIIEPEYNDRSRFRQVEVSIAGNMGAPALLVPALVGALVVRTVPPERGRYGPHANDYRKSWSLDRFVELLNNVETVDDWYLAFEAVHPFCDGNGRTGKILYNWLLGTLKYPVLVDDYFGGGNP